MALVQVVLEADAIASAVDAADVGAGTMNPDALVDDRHIHHALDGDGHRVDVSRIGLADHVVVVQPGLRTLQIAGMHRPRLRIQQKQRIVQPQGDQPGGNIEIRHLGAPGGPQRRNLSVAPLEPVGEDGIDVVRGLPEILRRIDHVGLVRDRIDEAAQARPPLDLLQPGELLADLATNFRIPEVRVMHLGLQFRNDDDAAAVRQGEIGFHGDRTGFVHVRHSLQIDDMMPGVLPLHVLERKHEAPSRRVLFRNHQQSGNLVALGQLGGHASVDIDAMDESMPVGLRVIGPVAGNEKGGNGLVAPDRQLIAVVHAFPFQHVENEGDGLAGKIVGGGHGGRFGILGMEMQMGEDHGHVGGELPLLAVDHQLLVDAPPQRQHAAGGHAIQMGTVAAKPRIGMGLGLGHVVGSNQ